MIPGLAILLSHVGVPPDSSTALFSGTLESIGVLTLMILWLNKERIGHLTNRAIVSWAFTGMIFFLIGLFVYIYLFGDLITEVPHSSPVFFPLWPEGELQTLMTKFPDRDTLIQELGRDDVVKIIHSSSKNALLITTITLLALYQLIFIPLIISFGLVAIKSIDQNTTTRPGSAEPKSRD